jgi:hypothetical protein
MCGGSRWMWPLSDVMKKHTQGTAEPWPEKLSDPVELQGGTPSGEPVGSHRGSETVV